MIWSIRMRTVWRMVLSRWIDGLSREVSDMLLSKCCKEFGRDILGRS